MKRTYSVQVRLTEEERQKAERVASQVTGGNKSELFRTLLNMAIPTYLPPLILQVKEEQHEQTA
jgi:hypothetical protein